MADEKEVGGTPPYEGGPKQQEEGGGQVKPPREGEVKPPRREVKPPRGEVKPPREGEVKPSREGEVKPPREGEVKPPTEGEVKQPTEGEVRPRQGGKVKTPQREVKPEAGVQEEKLRILNKYRAVILSILVIAIAITAAILLSSHGGQEQEARRERLRIRFDSFIDKLEASFSHQTRRFWRILRNRAAAHLKNPNPKKPLVFMFTAPPSAHNVLQCIARKFAQSLDYEDYGKGVIDSIDYTDYSSPDDAKKNLDDNLKQILEKGQNLLVLDVDKLPVQSPLLFYEYCDNENAPFKHAAIIFTVRLPSEPDPSLAPAKEEGLVAEYLREFWGKQDYRLDDVPPLVARMTDTVVMVKSESKEVVKRNCDN